MQGCNLASAHSLCHHEITMSISDVTNRRGRPVTTGKGTPVTVRLLPDPLADLDMWIARQRYSVSRPEAIRRLIISALAADVRRPTTHDKSADQKADLEN